MAEPGTGDFSPPKKIDPVVIPEPSVTESQSSGNEPQELSQEQVDRAEIQKNLVGVGIDAVNGLDEKAKKTADADRKFAESVENGVSNLKGEKEKMPTREQDIVKAVMSLTRIEETVGDIRRDAARLGLGTQDLLPEVKRLFEEVIKEPDPKIALQKVIEARDRFNQTFGLLQRAKSDQLERGKIISINALGNDEEIQRAKVGDDRPGEESGLLPMVRASRTFNQEVDAANGRLRASGEEFHNDGAYEADRFRLATEGIINSIQSQKT